MNTEIQPHAQRHAECDRAERADNEQLESDLADLKRREESLKADRAAQSKARQAALDAADLAAVKQVRLRALESLISLAAAWSEDPSRPKAEAIRSALIKADRDSHLYCASPTDPFLMAIAFAAVEVKKDPTVLEIFIRPGLINSHAGSQKLGGAVSTLRKCIEARSHAAEFSTAIGAIEAAVAALAAPTAARNPVPADAADRWRAVCECSVHVATERLRDLDKRQQQAATQASYRSYGKFHERLQRIARLRPIAESE